MTRTALLLLSAVLIGTGVLIVWRDVQRRRRTTFRVPGDATATHPDVEVVVAHTTAPGFPLPRIPTSFAPNPLLEAGASQGQSTSIEPAARWAALRTVLDAAVERVNGVLAGAGVTIAAPGEPRWSLMKRGFGVHRRLLIGADSVGWLRLELDANGQVQATVKAHKNDLAAINATASATAAGLDVARATELLSECLKLAAAYAVRGAAGASTSSERASSADWRSIDDVVAAALRAANGAFAEAGARFLPLGPPTWAADVQRHRLAVKVEVLGMDVARLHIERLANEIEVAVGVADARLANLGRRERLPAIGLTVHALAELIASCAWPAIAHYRERLPSA